MSDSSTTYLLYLLSRFLSLLVLFISILVPCVFYLVCPVAGGSGDDAAARAGGDAEARVSRPVPAGGVCDGPARVSIDTQTDFLPAVVVGRVKKCYLT